MYGYEPPKQDTGVTWGEVFVIIRVVFGIMFPILSVLVGTLGLLVVTVLLLDRSPLFVLFPIAVVAATVYWLLRRDRRLHREEERRVSGL